MTTKKKRSTKHTAASDAASAEASEGGPRGVWAFFIAIGIVLLLLVGIIVWNNYSHKNAIENNRYNGFDFSPAEGGLWVTHIQARNQPYDIPFYFHPRETESVVVDPNATLPIYRGPAEVYISVDPDEPSKIVIAAVEIARILGQKYNLFNLNVHSALTHPTATKVDVAIMDCRNATPDRVVIQFINGTDNVISRWKENPNCILMQYDGVDESVRVADRFSYMLLKIMR